MPAEKGIPRPEASAKRMDVRDYDSRTAWGWLSEDGQLNMSKEGVTYVDVEMVRLSFDAFLQQYNLSSIKSMENDCCAGCVISRTIRVSGTWITLKN